MESFLFERRRTPAPVSVEAAQLKYMQQDEATAVFDIVAYACGNWQETEA